jgi:hypothetical protein
MQPYDRTVVLVFFVFLSVVIAWVTETREGTLEEYALSRVARLYSVILPALILTPVAVRPRRVPPSVAANAEMLPRRKGGSPSSARETQREYVAEKNVKRAATYHGQPGPQRRW